MKAIMVHVPGTGSFVAAVENNKSIVGVYRAIDIYPLLSKGLQNGITEKAIELFEEEKNPDVDLEELQNEISDARIAYDELEGVKSDFENRMSDLDYALTRADSMLDNID